MKLKAKIYGVAAGFIAALSTVTLSGCHAIYDESDCVESYNLVKLEYTRNMKFADAFAPEVDGVTLYVFSSATGKLVQRIDADRKDLKDGNKVPLSVEPGKYDILVWAGGDRSKSFDITGGTPGETTLEEVHCRMQRAEREGALHRDDDLAPLFHGLVHVDLPYAGPSRPHEFTIPLTKDTNVIRVVLQHVTGETVNHNDFDFTITDRNGWLNHDNSLRDASTAINYHPWHTSTGSVDINNKPVDAPNNAPALPVSVPQARSVLGASLAEFTLNRLMDDTNPVLTVTNRATGATVLSVPVKDYALLVKGFYHREMSNQEYLDRQDEYNMTFFLDEGNRWVSTVIIINDWRIIRHNPNLE